MKRHQMTHDEASAAALEDDKPTVHERREMVQRGVCPDCRRPLVGTRVDRNNIRVACSRKCGYEAIKGNAKGLARTLGLEPRG